MAMRGIAGNPQGFTDAQLYSILTGASTAVGAMSGVPGIFSPANAKTIQTLCSNSYGVQTCADPTVRYKSSFANREQFGGRAIVKSAPKFTSRVETFSGANCANVCNDPAASPAVQNACKVGAIAYCNQSDNIYNDACSADLAKYPELADIKSNWCANNPTHPNYSPHCKSQIQQAAASTIQQILHPLSSAPVYTITNANGTTTEVATASSTWIWIMLGVLAFVLIAILIAVRMRRKRAATSAQPAPPFQSSSATSSINIPISTPAPMPSPMAVNPIAINSIAAPISSIAPPMSPV
jgi:hypothetical protein